MKKTIYFFIVITAVVATAELLYHSAGTRQNRTVNYVALGDSIAASAGATDGNGYAPRIYEYLKQNFGNVIYDNFAVSGHTTSDLLHILVSSDEARDKLRQADIITVCIGGNNIISTLKPNDRSNNLAKIAECIKTFDGDWQKIHTNIRKLNDKAFVVVSNIYNPVQPGDVWLDIKVNEEWGSIIDKSIRRINEIIGTESYREKYAYECVDTYGEFKALEGNLIPARLYHKSADVHPTDFGHVQMARLHIKAIEENFITKK